MSRNSTTLFFNLYPQISTVPDVDQDTLQTLRRGETEHSVDDEVMLSFHRDPALVKRLSSSFFSSPTSVPVPRLVSANTEPLNSSPDCACLNTNTSLNLRPPKLFRASTSPVSNPQKAVEINSESRRIPGTRKRRLGKAESTSSNPATKTARHKSRSL